jgi:hypothetical protein
MSTIKNYFFYCLNFLGILQKLNKKLTIIEKKLYNILKSSIRSRLLKYLGIEEKTKCIQKSEERKKLFIHLLAKYLKGTENFNEEEENSLLRESIDLGHEIIETINTGKIIDETWVLLNLKNKENDEIASDLKISKISEFNYDFK